MTPRTTLETAAKYFSPTSCHPTSSGPNRDSSVAKFPRHGRRADPQFRPDGGQRVAGAVPLRGLGHLLVGELPSRRPSWDTTTLQMVGHGRPMHAVLPSQFGGRAAGLVAGDQLIHFGVGQPTLILLRSLGRARFGSPGLARKGRGGLEISQLPLHLGVRALLDQAHQTTIIVVIFMPSR